MFKDLLASGSVLWSEELFKVWTAGAEDARISIWKDMLQVIGFFCLLQYTLPV